MLVSYHCVMWLQQVLAGRFQNPGEALESFIMGMDTTPTVMVGRWIAPQAPRRASPPTQLPSLRYGSSSNPRLFVFASPVHAAVCRLAAQSMTPDIT